ncbi:MAG: 4-hydroxythreonine-4-phosphate dehydrogenase PdxA, partial [Pirellulaceae bacterium]|nr:4-hydroxythreonine-4-phosphate dehydrogenase PdxA [Pirellulaceae bacterium]
MSKPLVAITLGDPAGVGPETIAGAWQSAALHEVCRLLAVGHPEFLRRAVKLLGLNIRVQEIMSAEEAAPSPALLPCLKSGDDAQLSAPPAQVSALGGQAAYDALILAADLAVAGHVDAITTAPLNKAALVAAGHDFPGHTELLAERCGIPWDEVAMMLYLAPGGPIRGRAGLGVAHVTLHMALRDVFAHLTQERILASARLADAVTRAFLSPEELRIAQPRIGIAALNPHAGEQGLFGNEELHVIAPAVQAGKLEGLNLAGPLPCDTLMVRAAAGDFDAVVAMYHDQGLAPLKMVAFDTGVNWTLGLPFIRTSPDHGTAYDIAGKGIANPSSMLSAIRLARELTASA